MTVYPSRSRRPESPSPLVLTDRDRRILTSVFVHRFLAARHIGWLHFRSRSLRAAQRRLRRLWEHGYLDRAFIPVVVLGEGSDVPHTGGPLYCLAARGARVVAETTGRDFARIPSTPAQNRMGFATLCHHLVATDWLTSLEAATAMPESPLQVTALVRERTIRAMPTKRHRLPVPDAAAALTHGEDTAWCYLEVVRADPRGGTKALVRKLERYARLHHQRAFRDGFGHHPLRRVLLVTPTEERRDRLRAAACTLTHGRGLFAFGSYGATRSASRPSGVTPQTVLAPMWQTLDDDSSDAPGLRSLPALHGARNPAVACER